MEIVYGGLDLTVKWVVVHCFFCLLKRPIPMLHCHFFYQTHGLNHTSIVLLTTLIKNFHQNQILFLVYFGHDLYTYLATLILLAKILIQIPNSADHPPLRLWLNWGGLTENAGRLSNSLIQISSLTRFPSSTVKFESNVKTLSTLSKYLSKT